MSTTTSKPGPGMAALKDLLRDELASRFRRENGVVVLAGGSALGAVLLAGDWFLRPGQQLLPIEPAGVLSALLTGIGIAAFFAFVQTRRDDGATGTRALRAWLALMAAAAVGVVQSPIGAESATRLAVLAIATLAVSVWQSDRLRRTRRP